MTPEEPKEPAVKIPESMLDKILPSLLVTSIVGLFIMTVQVSVLQSQVSAMRLDVQEIKTDLKALTDTQSVVRLDHEKRLVALEFFNQKENK